MPKEKPVTCGQNSPLPNSKVNEVANQPKRQGALSCGSIGWRDGSGTLRMPGDDSSPASRQMTTSVDGAIVSGLKEILLTMGVPASEIGRYSGAADKSGTIIAIEAVTSPETHRAQQIFEMIQAVEVPLPEPNQEVPELRSWKWASPEEEL